MEIFDKKNIFYIILTLLLYCNQYNCILWLWFGDKLKKKEEEEEKGTNTIFH